MLDENGNPIVEEDNDEEEDAGADEPDYKTLYETEKQSREKYENRFKKTAKELNEIKKTSKPDWDVNVSEIVSKQVQEEMFYSNNPTAKEFQKEIKEIQGKTNLSPQDAMDFYLAKNKPELLVKRQSDLWVDGVPKATEANKDPKDMTYDELRAWWKKRE